MGRHLTSQETARAIDMYHRGHTQKDIAIHFKVRQQTISNKIALFQDENRITRKTSRRLKASDDVLKQIQNHVEFDPYVSLSEIKEELPYSKMTISNYIKKFGFKSGISPKKFIVKPIPVEARLDFASLIKRLSVNQWKNIIFTDESGLDNSGQFRKRVWLPRSQRFDQKYVLKHANATLKRINFFSWIGPEGTGEIYFYEKMESETYCQIIEDMIRKLKDYYETEDFRMIHDNARFSTSKYTKEYLKRRNIEKFFIPMPTYSPDINIIENAWAILKHKVKMHTYYNGQTLDRSEFLQLIEREWRAIDIEVCDNLYASLPKRMHQILKSEGQSIKY